MESLILAQDERWRRASNMQVERSNWQNKDILRCVIKIYKQAEDIFVLSIT